MPVFADDNTDDNLVEEDAGADADTNTHSRAGRYQKVTHFVVPVGTTANADALAYCSGY